MDFLFGIFYFYTFANSRDKVRLANIITLLSIIFLSNCRNVLNIVVIRCIVVAVLTRGVLTLAFSLSGGILSALVMAMLYKKFSNMFSIKGIAEVRELLFIIQLKFLSLL
ncbi:Gx transporter family protein [Anaerobacillus sp. HL2]|nr:Gx transporter family protein [Anaerobacillus sp. HL2]